jgi:diguanylate cyclase (GGDEF)-like protein
VEGQPVTDEARKGRPLNGTPTRRRLPTLERLPPSLRKFLPVILTLFLGTSASLGIFFAFQASEQARLKSDFITMSADRAQAIRSGLEEDFIELNLLGSYIAASTELSQGQLGSFAAEFERYASRIPSEEADTQIVAFMPRVPGAIRERFEATMSRELDPGFSVKEPGANGDLIPAHSRPEYYPIILATPLEYSEMVFGLDLAAIPSLRAAIDHALSSGRITASSSIDLQLSTVERPTMWHFLAVYRKASTASGARGTLLGIAASAFRVDQMVELSLKDLSPAGIDIEILDLKAAAAQQLLYYHKSRIPRYAATGVIREGLTWSTTLNAGERTWTVNTYPTREFVVRHRSWLSLTLLVVGLILTLMGSVFFWGRLRRMARVESLVADRTRDLASEVEKHELLEKKLAESRTTLAGQVERLAQRNHEAELLNEVGDMLQSCLSTEEAFPVVTLHAPQLLPGSSGALYLHDPQQDLYHEVASWGGSPPASAAFKAEDCWALRRGKLHAVTRDTHALACRHLAGMRGGGSLCIPLAASGKSIGLLNVIAWPEESQAFAVSVAEHVGLALSNLMLRSDLRQLSIHDPLTGLFNRRYMEETFEIEIRRAERTGHSIGVIMLDLDHFKGFNDKFGHAAGDHVLRSLGTLLRTNLRAGDIACRYGGEEFVLILPDATEEVAAKRAEDIRQRASSLELRHQEDALGPITVSLGVAIHPTHGRSRTEILAAADAALYAAKAAGRNQVAIASGATEAASLSS